MVLIGFHASHEQPHPRLLLQDAVRAEQAGFVGVMCSDHLTPWTNAQGHCGFIWTWPGAALQATDHISMGSFHAPGQRYHPVISPLAIAVDQWCGDGVPALLAWDLTTPQQFETGTRHVPPSDAADNVHVSAYPGRHLAWPAEYDEMGFEELYLHHVRQDNEAFIATFGEQVVLTLNGVS